MEPMTACRSRLVRGGRPPYASRNRSEALSEPLHRRSVSRELELLAFRLQADVHFPHIGVRIAPSLGRVSWGTGCISPRHEAMSRGDLLEWPTAWFEIPAPVGCVVGSRRFPEAKRLVPRGSSFQSEREGDCSKLSSDQGARDSAEYGWASQYTAQVEDLRTTHAQILAGVLTQVLCKMRLQQLASGIGAPGSFPDARCQLP